MHTPQGMLTSDGAGSARRRGRASTPCSSCSPICTAGSWASGWMPGFFLRGGRGGGGDPRLQLPAHRRHGDGAGARLRLSQTGSGATATSTWCPTGPPWRTASWLEARTASGAVVRPLGGPSATSTSSSAGGAALAAPRRSSQQSRRRWGLRILGAGSELEYYIFRDFIQGGCDRKPSHADLQPARLVPRRLSRAAGYPGKRR